jgi:hypothetical protein
MQGEAGWNGVKSKPALRPKAGRVTGKTNLIWESRIMTNAPSQPAALPDRLASNPASPFYNEELLALGIGILFNGVEKTNVEEYCISEGWIRVAAGKAKDRKGQPLTILLKGKVDAFLKGPTA